MELIHETPVNYCQNVQTLSRNVAKPYGAGRRPDPVGLKSATHCILPSRRLPSRTKGEPLRDSEEIRKGREGVGMSWNRTPAVISQIEPLPEAVTADGWRLSVADSTIITDAGNGNHPVGHRTRDQAGVGFAGYYKSDTIRIIWQDRVSVHLYEKMPKIRRKTK